MAAREVKKKKDAVTASSMRNVVVKEKERSPVSVKPAVEINTLDTAETLQTTSRTEIKDEKILEKNEDSQEENKKDTGQEKCNEEGMSKEVLIGSTALSSPHYKLSSRKKHKEHSSSSFQKNVVEPLPADEQESVSLGSATSLRSHTSSKMAWPENEEKSNFSARERPESAASNASQVSGSKDKKKIHRSNKIKDSTSLKSETQSDDGRQQNAYIPYMYARQCIMRISNDMAEMKTKHIRIVKDIEKHYRAIEDETQQQFNGFVLVLREQYAGKVNTFKQVIELHRTELQQKEQFWNESLMSMTERINKLLKDRKILLITNRTEIEKLEKEKTVLLSQLTTRMDQEKSTASSMSKDYEKRLKEKEEKIGQLEEERKKVKDELESEKKEVIRLKALVAVSSGTTVVAAAEAKEGKTEKTPLLTAVFVSTSSEGVSEDERQRMENERQQMTADTNRMKAEQHDLMEKIKDLEQNLTLLTQESGKWQEKYNLLLQAGDAVKLREQYTKLESQYKALARVVTTVPQSSDAAKEKTADVLEEQAMIEAERQRLAKEIENWEREFKKNNKGKKPTEADKPDSAKELYIQMDEVKQMVVSLNCQKETLLAVQSGGVPPSPDVPPSTPHEALVSIVEVKVPDLDIVASLERSQAAENDLQLRILALQKEKAELQSKIEGLESAQLLALAQNTEKSEKLAAEMSSKEKELEALRTEKKEMAKDMKKMMRQYSRLQGKLSEATNDKELTSLLQMMAVLVKSIHSQHPEAAREIEQRLGKAQTSVQQLNEKNVAGKKALAAWDHKFRKVHGKDPEDKDRDSETQALYAAVLESDRVLGTKQLEVRALAILKSGVFKEEESKQQKSPSPATNVDQQLSDLDNKIIDLEDENKKVKEINGKLDTEVKALEQEIADLKSQLTLQSSLSAINQESSKEVSKLQQEDDNLKVALQQEQAAHDATREELEIMKKQIQALQDDQASQQGQLEANLQKMKIVLEAKLASKEEQLLEAKKKNDDLEKERLANIPLDTAKEIKNLQNKIAALEKAKEESKTMIATLQADVRELRLQLELGGKMLEIQRSTNRDLEGRVRAARLEKEKAIKDMVIQLEEKKQQKAALENKLHLLQAAGNTAVTSSIAAKAGAKAVPGAKGGHSAEEVAALKHEIRDLNARIKQLETEAARATAAAAVVGAGDNAANRNVNKRHEKILKELSKKLEMEQNRSVKLAESMKGQEEELKTLQKDCKDKETELVKLRAELGTLGVAAKEGIEAAGKVKILEAENKQLQEENRVLVENFNSERVLRKKYYNMVEDMKGKIRVYCRARPLSQAEKDRGNFSVVKSPDEYSIQVTSNRGQKEFQYDQIFMEDSTQEKVFEDTNNLIQSAVDGYNVCIFAYGQTGSGKTFTMIGDREQRFPGIAPRAFQRIFELGQENQSKFNMQVTAYMLELYNDRLIDLFARPGNYDEDKLEIKKDKKGLVYVQGAAVKEASNAKELNALFEEGSKNRHTASTKMNAESSRSHLIIGIVLEITSKATGNVVKGKLSLVDLAGSERVGKTGATADQLKEAMSINKSLSALGDVISALSSEQSFIPYRNSKLTMLMQDSLGGNAKTLMFVNISPADYNADETVISLMYASRVKLITNDASKNADNKEIARLKGIIAKLKAGERVEEEV